MAQTSFGSVPLVHGADINSNSATQLMPLGAYAETVDGRGFRYFLNGGTSTVAARIYQAAAEDTTNFQSLTITNAVVGDMSIVSTTTKTISAAQSASLAGGYVTVISATLGSGRSYKIKSVPAVSAAAVTINLEDPVAVATTGTAIVDFHPAAYSSVIVTPAGSATSCPVGVSTYVVTNAQYGWLQVRGPAPVLSSTAITVGNNVMPLFATAAGAGSAAIDGVKSSIGFALTGVATTDVGLVFLTIG
jgi:hypothetical protein